MNFFLSFPIWENRYQLQEEISESVDPTESGTDKDEDDSNEESLENNKIDGDANENEES